MIRKTNYNSDQKELQESDEEDCQIDQQYEQERFTDEYSEYFEDDENKADRLTDDYQEDLKD